MTHRTNIVTGAVLTVFAVAYLLLSLNIKVFKTMGMPPLDSTFVPRLWGVCLLLLSSRLLLRGLSQRKALIKSGKETPPANFNLPAFFQKNYQVVLTFVFIAIYCAFMKTIGFTIMTALYLFAQILVLSPLGKKKYVLSAIIGVVAAMVINYIFVVLLNVMLPRGIFSF